MPSGKKLAGRELKLFNSKRRKIEQQYGAQAYSMGHAGMKLVKSLD